MALSTASKLTKYPVAEIVEDGDLLLVVGTGKAHQRLKVSSRVLTLASVEFEAMVERANQNQEEEPIAKSLKYLKVYLSKDNSQAMKLLMFVLHGKYTAEIQEIESTHLLAEISLLIRKYGLVGKMGYLLDYIRLKQQSLENFENCIGWFVALLSAHRHSDSVAFQNLSRLLILNHGSKFSRFIDTMMVSSFEFYEKNIVYEIVLMLESARSQVEWQLQAKLLGQVLRHDSEHLDGSRGDSGSCNSHSSNRALLIALDDMGLYFPCTSLYILTRPSITDMLVQFYEKDLWEISRNYDSMGRTRHTRISGVAIRIIESLIQNVRGACLHCYKWKDEALVFGCEDDYDREPCYDNLKLETA